MTKNTTTTTIWIKKDTKKKLDNFKIIPDETYDSLINRIITKISSS